MPTIFTGAARAALLLTTCRAFYLPGVAPQDYARDDIVYMKVNKLSSTRTQLPFEYYSLPYCRPHKVAHSVENLGEVLRGDRIENSLYSLIRPFCLNRLGVMLATPSVIFL